MYERAVPVRDPQDDGMYRLLDGPCHSHSRYRVVFWCLEGFPWPSSATTEVQRNIRYLSEQWHYNIFYPLQLRRLTVQVFKFET